MKLDEKTDRLIDQRRRRRTLRPLKFLLTAYPGASGVESS
jgi:hypothetical protein